LIVVGRGEGEASPLLETECDAGDNAVVVHLLEIAVKRTRGSGKGDAVGVESCQPAITDVPILITTSWE
jgi:hypothetical protein